MLAGPFVLNLKYENIKFQLMTKGPPVNANYVLVWANTAFSEQYPHSSHRNSSTYRQVQFFMLGSLIQFICNTRRELPIGSSNFQ